jgi:predicted protein tyrosine phosphatase
MTEQSNAAREPTAENGLDLVICGLHEIDVTLDARVTHVISILDPGTEEPAKFAELDAARLLRLRFNDIIEVQPAGEPPGESHIAALVEFGGAVAAHDNHRALIHCHMGISRSTAAAIILVADQGRDAEAAVARVTALRPIAWPNLRMIELADALLGFDRRLVHAVRRHHATALLRRPELRDAFIRTGRAREVEGLEGLI